MTSRAPVDPDVVTLIANAPSVLNLDPATTVDEIRAREARSTRGCGAMSSRSSRASLRVTVP